MNVDGFYILLRDGLGVHMHPKSWHCQKGGGSAPCQDIFGGFVHNALRALQGIIHHQKVIISPQKCAIIPQNRSSNHTFSEMRQWLIYEINQQDTNHNGYQSDQADGRTSTRRSRFRTKISSEAT